MAETTISNGYYPSLTITSANFANPVIITGTGTLDTATYFGFFGPPLYDALDGLVAAQWTIINQGLIHDATYTGISLNALPGAQITNAATGTIIGGRKGIYISGAAGTVINQGLIENGGGGYSGHADLGIDLAKGGLLNNGSGAQLFGGETGFYATGAAATVVNAGIVSGGLEGVVLTAGGTVTNASGGQISGGKIALSGEGAAVTVSNAGTIAGAANVGVYIRAGGVVTNDAMSTIAAGSASDTQYIARAPIAGIQFNPVAGTVINYGLISAMAARNNPSQVAGIALGYGGLVSNAVGGTIATNDFGILFSSGAEFGYYAADATAANLVNAGTVSGGYEGVFLNAGGAITNTSGALLYGGLIAVYATDSVYVTDSAAVTVLNAGDIVGAIGIDLGAGGAVTNAATGTITGGTDGVVISTAGTVINAGTITGGINALLLGGGRLIVDPGAVFNGSVEATGPTSSILELASGGIAGVLRGVGTQFLGFNTLSIDTGASWLVEGDEAGLTSGATGTVVLDGFARGDTIVLDGFGATSDTYVSGIGLELSNGTTTVTLDITGDFSTSSFIVIDRPQATTISLDATAPCFAAGTRILTQNGEVPVEQLEVGDKAILADGSISSITWIGKRSLRIAHHPRPEAVRPIRIRAGAIGNDLPARDLILSPDHALYLEGHLVPAKALLNGHSITQLNWPAVTYYHIELAEHAVLLAEGTPAESYLETGNRGAFENGGTVAITLHPDFAESLREATGCAPFAEFGPAVETIRAVILARANIETTADPALTIHFQNGEAIISSRSAIPGELTPDPRDRRTLGVKLASLTIDGAEIPIDHPALTTGWHALEPDGRWTNGAAIIPASLLQTSKAVRVTLAATLNYPLPAVLKRAS